VGKRAAIVFIDAFLGSLATLMVSSTIVDIDSDVLPDAVLLLELLLSAVIAGMIAVIGVARDALNSMNGEA
jgi:hypothetical protein